MAKCLNCGTRFDVSTVRDEYEEYVGDGDYDGELCAECAIPDLESNLNLGHAIMMMNGDEDYDEDHVEKWL
ncbi:hypothetical protein ACQP1V_09030 [Microtetraspora malaysiensis]|uniref:hypothetical protein n=1 Tax=Microtetraspora malaysiensis TaxID=161358 RepID=UPI003D8F6CF0